MASIGLKLLILARLVQYELINSLCRRGKRLMGWVIEKILVVSKTPWPGPVCIQTAIGPNTGDVNLIAGYVKSDTYTGYQWEADDDKGDALASGPAFSQQDAQTKACNWAKSNGFTQGVDPHQFGCEIME